MSTFWPPIRYTMSAGQEIALNGRWQPLPPGVSLFTGYNEPSDDDGLFEGDYWFHPDEGLYELVDVDNEGFVWQAVAA